MMLSGLDLGASLSVALVRIYLLEGADSEIAGARLNAPGETTLLPDEARDKGEAYFDRSGQRWESLIPGPAVVGGRLP